MKEEYSAAEIEARWQKKWEDEGVFHSEPDEREKFFLTIPYPYLNGNLHAGHTRTFTIGDAVARFRRMRGQNVLFPMAFHATGTPIVGLSELIANRDPLIWEVYTKLHGIPEEELVALNTPEAIVAYFRKAAKVAMGSIGFSIDWRREFTTTDPAYKKFIEWQFGILHDLDYVTKGSHPVRWCPHDQNPVEDHDILKGEEATIMDFALIKFRIGDRVLPCATLRPETVFGVTNLWVNPDVMHVVARVNQELWVVSPDAYHKLTFTDREMEWVGEVSGRELIGQMAENPITRDRILILPAGFVDPDNGSGIVMSVPAHAPFDYLALKDLYGADLSGYGITEDLRDIRLISLIKVPGYGEFPAVDAVSELGVRDQHDPRAEEATKLVYRREFHNGILKENTGKYSGIPVQKIKEPLLQDLIDQGAAEIFYEFSESPVICRCGTTCVVKMVRDQWFLEYSNPAWKSRVLACLAGMRLIPEEIRQEFINKVDWLKDKACARRKGLGTLLPWDREWLIESLADSTIYMSFYILAKYVNAGLNIDRLEPAFFDYIFLGKGDPKSASKITGIDEETVQKIRTDFQYWYPVDLRTSGKDLVANHLLFFLFHHVAIYPESLWPKAIAVNGFVSLEGRKMSKSKGPILTLRQAVSENGADVTRLYILGNAEYTQDADWRSEGAQSIRSQVERFYSLARDILKDKDPQATDPGEQELIDRWMISRLQQRISETTEAMEGIQTRRALQSAFYHMQNDLRWYQRRGGRSQLCQVLSVWVRLMAPFTPHICEEIWSELGQGYVAHAPWPLADKSLIDEQAELAESLLQSTQNDVEEILRVTGAIPEKISLYTAPEWKREMLRLALDISSGGRFDMSGLMKAAMADPEIAAHKKEAPKYAQKLAKTVHGQTAEILELDELQTLSMETDYLSRTFGCPVRVLSADQPGPDPMGKSRNAEPGRPAIWIE
ncbi:MAG TPA: leucine--tRNA ligase [Methanothrix soehngenii]|nr:leucine--tRNA ligase [Methanotrichaceae archaeon]HQF16428.1 leucine--tRNA ligase [Methanotrichaceae archaeon]HQI53781.1 leucine--tRNA ligase [Methanothrix soehngenii]HQI91186.1 leucine--tRNA ligase [Methanotrichaceae archaeon]HQJ28409.1 leucine--tRNA ligase [Methanotrichaceae archaeon]